MMKAVFLDKDGTLIPDIPYNVDPALITIQQNALQGLKLLQRQGYMLILVSNQAGIARGYFPLDSLIAVEERLLELLKPHQIHLDAFYYCPHHTNGIEDNYAIDCNCRKPRPGMLLQAASDHNINLSASWMIGDILDDVEAGNRAGCKTILIDNGNETEWLGGDFRTPTLICRNINEAAECILNKQYA